MLGAMPQGVRATKDGVRLQISGEQGFKAHNIKFKQRRNFFAFDDKQVKRIVKLIKQWMAKKNK
jgi:hypothetical protein